MNGIFGEDGDQAPRGGVPRGEARLRVAVDGLMERPEGRAFLRWLLAACRAFEAQAPGPGASPLAERLIFAEGARQVGMQVLRLLEAASPAHFSNLLLTREDDDARDTSGGHPPAGLHAR